MTRVCRLIPSAAVFGLLVAYSSSGQAQTPPTRNATAPSSSAYARAESAIGDIQGVVLDEQGVPVAGVMVSMIGRTVQAATSNAEGRFALRALPFGPYLLRAHLPGYWPSRTRTVQLTSANFTVPAIELLRVGAATRRPGEPGAATQLAGLDDVGGGAAQPDASAKLAGEDGDDNHGETAWRIRHLPRSVLKEATESAWIEDPDLAPDSGSLFGRAMGTPARLASSLLGDFPPVSGELNLLTTGSFDSPEQLFSSNRLARGVTYLSVGTQAVGGEWSMQGAMTQGDLASWIVAGSYTTAQPARHAYEVGMSYSMQRYDGGNSAALAAVGETARNVGTVYGFDRWTVSPRVVLGYGSRYARYDYVSGPGLWSPRVSISVAPFEGLRVEVAASERALAPGAEEFVPPVTGLWLPPERTFSPLAADREFRVERTRHYQVSVERDVTDNIIVAMRAFQQRVDDQLVTMFGVRVPGQPIADLGHYYVANAGDIDMRGWAIGITQEIAGCVRGSVDYSATTAYWAPSSATTIIALWAPSAARQTTEQVHDLRTSLEAKIPQTSTRVYALYRVNTAFARSDAHTAGPGTGARFDVRVNQSLPFLNFSSAQWEMLIDVRNLFREPGVEASAYDELLVVRPPKRIVGGLMVRF